MCWHGELVHQDYRKQTIQRSHIRIKAQMASRVEKKEKASGTGIYFPKVQERLRSKIKLTQKI